MHYNIQSNGIEPSLQANDVLNREKMIAEDDKNNVQKKKIENSKSLSAHLEKLGYLRDVERARLTEFATTGRV